MAQETGVQSQVESYQRLKKWHLMSPCLTLSIIRYGSRVKWTNPGKGIAPSPTPRCSKLLKKEPLDCPWLRLPTLLLLLLFIETYICFNSYHYRKRSSNPGSGYLHFTFCIDTLRKGMNPSLFLPVIGKY